MGYVLRDEWHTAQKHYICDGCNRHYIEPGERYRYMYGSAHNNEGPEPIRLCNSVDCGGSTEQTGNMSLVDPYDL